MKYTTYNRLLFIHKKGEILPFVITWMLLDGIMLSEIGRERQILHDITYTWNLKKQQQQHKRKSKLTDTENILVVASGRQPEQRANRMKGVKRCRAPGVPVVAQWLIRLGTMRLPVRSLPLLRGLRIRCSCELWCRL